MIELLRVSAIGAAASAGLLAWSVGASHGQDHPQPAVGATPPVDVDIPAGFPDNPIAFFDDYSWRTFVALNWPAQAGARGVPDSVKKLGDAADNVVWETWKADYEIFQPEGQRPAEWDSFATASPCPDLPVDSAGRAKVLGTAGVIATAINHFNQAGFGDLKGTLIAQNKTYTRYEIRVNRAEFEFIRGVDGDPATFRYLAENLPAADAEPIVFPFGSIEIKAAWREFKLPEESHLLPRYYVRKTILTDPPNKTCRHATVGLVGLHIVHRTPSRPEWIWSTFEHVDNLVAPAGIHPTYRDPANTTAPQNVLEAVVDEAHPPKPSPTLTQVHRIKEIHESTQITNDLYHADAAIAGTVWENYQLVMTQWPQTPAATEQEFKQRSLEAYPQGAGNPFPVDAPGGAATAISNVSMETTSLFQRQMSCMRCHFSRVNSNTEFVWFLRLRAYDPDADSVDEKQSRIAKFSAEMLEAME